MNPRRAMLQNGQILFEFPYDIGMINQIKTLSGRAWNPAIKKWSAPLTLQNLEWAEAQGFTPSLELSKWGDTQRTPLELSGPLPKTLEKLLFPFQKEGVHFAERMDGRWLNCDDMGLGKTRQALGWLHLRPDALPAVIVCPASVKGHWAREAKLILPGSRSLVWEKGKVGKGVDLLIINYDRLAVATTCPTCRGQKRVPRDGDYVKCKACKGTGKIVDLQKDIAQFPRRTVILDESHYLATPLSQRTQAATLLTQGVSHVTGLTGTPMRNRTKDFFTILNLIRPDLFPSWWKFANRYCGAHHGRFGWDFSGTSNSEELHLLLTRNLMIRREKADVLKDLPPLIRTVIPLELANPDAYRAVEQEWLKKIREAKKTNTRKGSEALEMIEQLKQETVRQKLPACVEWIRDFLESGQKLIVFCEHQFVVKALVKAFPGVTALIDGGTAQAQRQKQVDEFQTNPRCRLFIGTKAAKEGITLTAASNIATLELWWTPGDHDQADGRHHRIGQKADSVTAWYLLAEGTIEETIATMLDEKRANISQVVLGKPADSSINLTELLQRYRPTGYNSREGKASKIPTKRTKKK